MIVGILCQFFLCLHPNIGHSILKFNSAEPCRSTIDIKLCISKLTSTIFFKQFSESANLNSTKLLLLIDLCLMS